VAIPNGLAQDRIPVSARIVAVAEGYDVLTHDQAYRAALTRSETLDEICHAAGTQLDPELAIVACDLLHRRGQEIERQLMPSVSPAALRRPSQMVGLTC
jgi:HD-GYP domain-containing protein (c-di-GMP phosphodiesterase class II)